MESVLDLQEAFLLMAFGSMGTRRPRFFPSRGP
jgi:hypothetical protein